MSYDDRQAHKCPPKLYHILTVANRCAHDMHIDLKLSGIIVITTTGPVLWPDLASHRACNSHFMFDFASSASQCTLYTTLCVY